MNENIILPPLCVDLAEIPTLVAVMFPNGEAVAFDIRAEEGNQPIMATFRFMLDEGRIIGLWDSDGVMPSFSIGKGRTCFVVCDQGGFRGAFASLEGAVKHGMTMWDGYRGG